MDKKGKAEKTSVLTDLLIVLVLSNFVLQNVQQWPLVPLLLVVFAFFVSLRSPSVNRLTQPIAAGAATLVFLRDVYLFQGGEAAFKVVILLFLLGGLYFLLHRIRRFFPM